MFPTYSCQNILFLNVRFPIEKENTSSWCYKTIFGGNLENLAETAIIDHFKSKKQF